jgi:hopanoid-associated phosphorylase
LVSAPGCPPFGVVTGLAFEAAAARRGLAPTGAIPIALSGGNAARALDEARRLLAEGAGGLLSFGTAGALAPALAAGDLIVATEVLTETGGAFAADRTWCDGLAAAASGAGMALRLGAIRAVDRPATTSAEKSALYKSCAALAIDMESGAVARAARDAGLPFAVLRVVIDPADRDLPEAAILALAADGRIGWGPLLRSLGRDPSQIGALLALARDAAAARRKLGRAAALLGGFGR